MSDAGVAMELDEPNQVEELQQEVEEEPQLELQEEESQEELQEGLQDNESEQASAAGGDEEPAPQSNEPGDDEPRGSDPMSEQASVAGGDEDSEPRIDEPCHEEPRVACQSQVPVIKRSKDQGQEKERLAKRPRWGDKAFEEITIGDVELLVRKCNSLEKKVEANAEVVAQLQELQSEKKGLVKQLVDVGSDEVARVKSSIFKQLYGQMHYVFAWNAELKDGRSISAFVPNVSLQLLKALGGSTDKPQQRRSIWYFETPPSKKVQPTGKKNERPAGSALVLGPNITLKYFKTTSELQVLTQYKFGNPEKQKPKAGKRKGKGKGRKSAEEGEDGVEGEDGEEPEDDDLAEYDADEVGDAADVDQGIALGGQ